MLKNLVKIYFNLFNDKKAALWDRTTLIRKYYCETCDKSFRTDDDWILHDAEHETCGRDGCEFTAHPKIIAKHIRMQHDTGLYHRIGKLYTEEDIAKWIEERKKRYPSRKVIEEKKALEEEKIKRGERIKDDDSKFNKSFSNKNRKNRSVENKTDKVLKTKRSRRRKKNSTIQYYAEEENLEIRTGVAAFIGIKKSYEPEESTERKKEDFISDDDWENNSTFEPFTKPVLNNSLGLLASNYNSDEEVIDKESEKENKNIRMSEDEGSGPEEVKTIRDTNRTVEEHEKNLDLKKRKLNKKQIAQENKKRKIDFLQDKPQRRELTLLEKLLKNEIRHERNVILQCIHYIVQNNFFDNT